MPNAGTQGANGKQAADPIPGITPDPRKRSRTVHFLDAVPLFKAGVHQGKPYTIKDLDEIARNSNSLINSRLLVPPVKLGHDEKQVFAQREGLPKLGELIHAYRLGDQLFGDFGNVPEELMDWIGDHTYTDTSIELYEKFQHPATHENIGKTIRAVAFLGQDIPEVKGMGSILYNSASESDVVIITFSEQNLSEANAMITKWKLEDVKKYIPNYAAAIEKHFAENKITELADADLVKVISALRFADPGTAPAANHAGQATSGDTQEQKLAKRKAKVAELMGADADEGKQTSEQKSAITEVMGMLDGRDEVPEQVLKDAIEQRDTMGMEPEAWGERCKKLGEYFASAPVKTFPDDKRPPKEWFDKAVAALKGKVDDPEAVAAWNWYYGMGPERKAKVEATSTSASEGAGAQAAGAEGVDPEEAKKAAAAQEAAKMAEKEKADVAAEREALEKRVREFNEKAIREQIERIKTDNRGVFIPALDGVISAFTEYVLGDKDVVKFSEKDYDGGALFIQLLTDIAKNKPVTFGEHLPGNAANKNGGNSMADKIEVTEQEVLEHVKQFSEKRGGEGGTFTVDNEAAKVDLLARKIQAASAKPIAFVDAVMAARKQLGVKD